MTGGQMAALAVAAVLVFWMVGAYNRLVGLRNKVGAAWQQVDEALQRRGEAVAPLVAAVRDGLVGEGAALDALLTAQAQVAAAADGLRPRPVIADAAQVLVRAEALMAAASARVLALLDLQAELRASDAVAPHVQALRDAEPRLAFVRQLFNDAVQAYNDAARQWPTRLLTRLFGFGTAGRL
ncbi:LemA family protein [Rubrivivax albus]|uniref:LemA family protein n=1 Tax=Rubrivivax albus TaxID=2499835 RepID=A0A437JXS5_9BURK|nr:LemA family protein [Rubrivivax albus]RVT52446.1 LemA family protein [Rubrivivax albus]